MEPSISTSSPQQPEQLTHSTSRKRSFILAIILAIIILAIISTVLFFLLHKNSNSSSTHGGVATVNGTLRVGTIPFIYPCNVAKATDFISAFGLSTNLQDTHSIQETSPLSPSQIPATDPPTTDLFKIIHGLNSSVDSVDGECDLTGMVAGTKTIDNIQVSFSEFASQSAAESGYNGLLEAAKTDSTPPAPLNSVSDNNFLEVPDANSGSMAAILTMAHGNNLVELDYELATGEQMSTIEPKLAAFAQSISKSMDATVPASTPTDLTGTATFVNKPLTDVCRQTDLLAVGQILGTITFRPDKMIDNSIYGSGESAGSVSDCEVTYNTNHDRATNKAMRDLDKYYARQLTLRTSTYKDNTTAHTALENQQTIDKKGTTFSTLSNMGDDAYKTTNTFHNPDGTTTVTTTYRIQQADHVISIIFAQPDNAFTDEQVAQVYKLVDGILKQ